MLRKIARKSAIVLSLTILAIPVKELDAQALPSVVTGANPVPTGEGNSAISSGMVLMVLFTALSSV